MLTSFLMLDLSFDLLEKWSLCSLTAQPLPTTVAVEKFGVCGLTGESSLTAVSSDSLI